MCIKSKRQITTSIIIADKQFHETPQTYPRRDSDEVSTIVVPETSTYLVLTAYLGDLGQPPFEIVDDLLYCNKLHLRQIAIVRRPWLHSRILF